MQTFALPYPLLQGSLTSEEAKQLQTDINKVKVSANMQYLQKTILSAPDLDY